MHLKQVLIIFTFVTGKTLGEFPPNFSNFFPSFGQSHKGNGNQNQYSEIQKPAKNPDIADQCFKASKCDPDEKYRRYDGSCNNLKFPVWGMANTAFIRVVEPRYSDGIHKPPRSVAGGYLKNAREIRLSMFPDKDVPHDRNTIVIMQWGQFVAHDTALSIPTTLTGKCCPKDYESDTCYPIRVSPNDPFYGQFKHTCMDLIRTKTTKNIGCKIKEAQQINANTHFVDASAIYGSDEKLAQELRGQYGLLKAQKLNGGYYPMQSVNPSPIQSCDRSSVCFKAGDERVNQNTQLTVIQTLMLREHNRVATIFRDINPKWDDERVYQETRRYLTAVMQHITYHNWLPYIMGNETMRKANLYPADEGYSSDYDPNLNPSTMNEFTTAAYRYFHSLIQGRLYFYTSPNSTNGDIYLGEWFNRPSIVTEKFDQLTQGMVWQPCQKGDRYYTEQITNFMFKESKKFGQDLEAVDIQRGRDHGIATYNSLREYCKIGRVYKFEDLRSQMIDEHIELLKENYKHVNDIDAFTGISLESHIYDAMIGPTGLCILTEQFRRWKAGDRYFYDLEINPGKFTPEQLKEIKKATLSRIVCDNGDNIKQIQKNIWERISYSNPIESCDKVDVIDLNKWKEQYA